MSAPTSGALTTAGYTQGATGVYSKTFGSIVVTFNISDEPSGGLLTVTPSGDVSQTDIASAQISLISFGYPVASQTFTAAGGTLVYSQSL